MTVHLILEPIFEADFCDCSYGFLPERSAHQAIDEVVQAIETGRTQVYDADLQSCFDTIPHEKLIKAIEHRVADRLRELTGTRYSFCVPEGVVKRLNLFLKGCGSYFCKGAPSKTFSKMNYFVWYRLMRFLRRKSQKGYKLRSEENWYKLFTRFGLCRLRKKMFFVKV